MTERTAYSPEGAKLDARRRQQQAIANNLRKLAGEIDAVILDTEPQGIELSDIDTQQLRFAAGLIDRLVKLEERDAALERKP